MTTFLRFSSPTKRAQLHRDAEMMNPIPWKAKPMERHALKRSEKPLFVGHIIPVAMLGMLLVLVPGAFGQHGGGGHSGGVSGGHVGGFSGGGFHGGFSASPSFRGFSGTAPHSFGAPSRMTWSAPRYSSAMRRGVYGNYRPPFNAGDRRGGDHRGRYRRPYPGYGYGYPYGYANPWGLLPWDLGYPDFTDYGDDSDSAGSNNAQAPPYPVQPPDEEQQQPPPESEDFRPEYAPAPYQPPVQQQVASTPQKGEPQLTLIFKDGHTLTIRNYMLTPSEIIVMDDAASGREPRIPLAELDLPATEKAAQQHGLDFSPPSA